MRQKRQLSMLMRAQGVRVRVCGVCVGANTRGSVRIAGTQRGAPTFAPEACAMCACVCIRMCAYMCIRMCAYMCVRVGCQCVMSVYMYVCIYVCMYICMYASSESVWICMHVCACVCMHACWVFTWALKCMPLPNHGLALVCACIWMHASVSLFFLPFRLA
jgi:hypothetical protein